MGKWVGEIEVLVNFDNQEILFDQPCYDAQNTNIFLPQRRGGAGMNS